MSIPLTSFQKITSVLSAAVVCALAALAVSSGPVTASNAKQALLAGSARRAEVLQQLTTAEPRAPRVRQLYVPGHVVVKFAPSLSERTMQVMVGAVGGTRLTRPTYADFHYVDIPVDVDPVQAAAALAHQPGVIYAEPDAAMYLDFVPNDPLYRFQWHFHRLDMERVWDVNPGGDSSVTVAVIDSGVAFLNSGGFARAPEFATTRFVAPFDFVWGDQDAVDLDGHGTHVASTIAQNTNDGIGGAGIAFNASIMPLKAICTDWDFELGAPMPTGCGGVTVARAIRYAVDNGAKVLNLSLGGPAPSTPLRDALIYAAANGAVSFVAAGNDAERGNPVEYPAAYSDIAGVVTVGALDYNFNRSYYSGFRDYVELSAPGGDCTADENNDGVQDCVIQQTLDPNFVAVGIFNRFSYPLSYHGTSMATPHAAALAALLVDQGITSPAAIEAAMKQFSADISAAGRDPETGEGVIQPRATLLGLGLAR